MCGQRYDVRPEGAAVEALERMKPALRARVFQAFRELEVNPYPRHLETATDFLSLKAVKVLQREGYDIYRLRTRHIGGVRIFYFVIEPECRVIVKEVVKKTSQTYELNSPHIQRILQNYEQWGLLARGKEPPC